jgi:hypothetical protein
MPRSPVGIGAGKKAVPGAPGLGRPNVTTPPVRLTPREQTAAVAAQALVQTVPSEQVATVALQVLKRPYIQVALTAALSFTGSFAAGKLYAQVLTAALSFVGSFLGSRVKALSAALSFTGSIAKTATRRLVSRLTVQNLCTNPGNSTSTTGWTGTKSGWDASGIVATTVADAGTIDVDKWRYNITASLPNSTLGLAGAGYSLPVVAGETYTVSLDGYAKNAYPDWCVFADGYGTGSVVTTKVTGVRSSFTFTATSTATILVGIQTASAYTSGQGLYFDNVQIFAGNTGTAWSVLRSLAAGLSFVGSDAWRTLKALTAGLTFNPVNLMTSDDATLEGSVGTWVVNTNASSAARTTARSREGAAALEVTITASGDSSVRNAQSFSATPCTANTTYSFLWSAIQDGSWLPGPSSMLVQVGFWTSGGGGLSGVDNNYNHYNPSSSVWTDNVFTFVSPPNAAFMNTTLWQADGSTAPTGSKWYADRMGLFRGTPSSWTAPSDTVSPLSRRLLRALSGAAGFTGGVLKNARKVVSGALSFVGGIATNLIHSGGTAYTQAVNGVLSFAGAMTKRASRAQSGALTFTGSDAWSTRKALGGTASFTGSTVKASARSLAAGLSFVGSQAKKTFRALVGALGFTGSVALKQTLQRALTGVLTFTGSAARRTSRATSGALGFTGSVTKRSARSLTAGLSFVGSQIRFNARSLAAGL